MKGAVFILVTAGALGAADLVSEPVVMQAEQQGRRTDEKGAVLARKPAYLSIFLGNRFSLPDNTGVASAQSFATTHIVRSGETIYNGTGPAIDAAPLTQVPQPTVRLEYEVPFERVPFLPSWGNFSAQLSLETGFSGTHNVASAAGTFTYQNSQANDPALKNLAYSGSLAITEKRQNLTPMLGIGLEFTNATLQRWSEIRFLMRLGAGVSLANGRRSYGLSLAPQYVTAVNNTAFSDTYVVKSEFTQTYAMAPLLAGRLELGARMRVGSNLHLSVVGSLTVLYGTLPYDSIGSFTEQAGSDKIMYQKIVATTSDQDYLGLAPAAFLALSLEI